MIYDLSKLAIIGLGSDGGSPTPSGIHLRWGFGSELSFPKKGFKLYRRASRPRDQYCRGFSKFTYDQVLRGAFQVDGLSFVTRQDLVVDHAPSNPTTVSIFIDRAEDIQVIFPEECRTVTISVEGRRGSIDVRAFHRGKLLATAHDHSVTRPTTVEVNAQGITHIAIDARNLYIVRICWYPVIEVVGEDPRQYGWELIATPRLEESFNKAEPQIIDLDRIDEFKKAYKHWIHDAALTLYDTVDPTPAYLRTESYIDGQATPVPPGTDPGDEALSTFNVLSLLLMGSLDPAFARMIGLAYVDQATTVMTVYDYLVVGLWEPERYYAIVYNLARVPAPPLSAPTGVVATPFKTAVAQPGQTGTSIGVVWDAPLLSTTTPVGFDAVWYDIQGARAGPAGNASPTTPVAYPPHPLNTEGRIVITGVRDSNGRLVYPKQYFIHFDRRDGWWGYQVKGYDIFGRESGWSSDGFTKVLDKTPPPAPRLLDTMEGPDHVQVPVRARYLDSHDPGLSTADRAILTAASANHATVVEWTWFAEQQAIAPDTKEFRIYYHPSFSSEVVTVLSVGAPSAQTVTATLSAAPSFNCIGGLLTTRGTSFTILAISGSTLTLSRAPKPQSDGSVVLVEPATGQGSVMQAVGNPRRWQRRLHVQPLRAGTPAGNYRAVIKGILLSPTTADPVATGWIGVTAVDDKSYISDDPNRTGPLAGRPGNESEIAVRARITAINRTPPGPGPAPSGSVFATRADYYGISRYTLTWAAASPTTYHVWRATESAVAASDFRARRERTAGTYYASHQVFADDPGFSAWLASEFPSVTRANMLAASPSAEALAAWTAWQKRFYDRDALSDSELRAIADRTPNQRGFTQITKQAQTAGSYDDEFDGRVKGRYLYKIQAVNPNGLVGDLGLSASPVSLHDVVPPRPPVITKIAMGDRVATLSWTPNTERDLDHYEIFRARVDTSPNPSDIRTLERRGGDIAAADVSFEDGDLVPAKDYLYVLVAVDTSGNKSLTSAPRQCRGISTSPPAIPSIAAVRTADGVDLTWNSPEDGARGYVERAEDGSEAWITVSGWLPPDQDSFTDLRAPETAAKYRLKVQDAVGNVSGPSAEVTVP